MCCWTTGPHWNKLFIYRTICGVAVVCEGGGDVRVASRITELVGALLDVPSNRVCVEQRRTRN